MKKFILVGLLFYIFPVANAASLSGKSITVIDANMSLKIKQGRFENNNLPNIIRYCIGNLEFLSIGNKDIVQVINRFGKPKSCF
ncbi:MAG: hypothetical protein HON94_03485 [Methylococcales bacterium]|nr:hypothetical protein [Methylococcales bacterium]